MNYKVTWNLDQVLHGAGSSYEKIDKRLDDLLIQVGKLPSSLKEVFAPYQDLLEEIHEAGSLITCLSSTDISDMRATQAEAKYNTLAAALDSASETIDAKLLELSENEFETLLKQLPEIAFAIQERRTLAKEKMPLEKELLVNDLAVSGHSAYSTLYYSFMGNLSFGEKKLNLSRLEKLFSNSDRTVRKTAFEDMEKELTRNEAIFAQILNNIVDFRLTLYKQRGWKSYLQETLRENRLQEKTLTTMWDVISQNKQPLVQYMDAKAKLLGMKQLSWCDVDAPIGAAEDSLIPWEAGCKNILEQFGKVSPRLAEFTEKALKQGWVDAKPSDKKRAGGFCTGIPLLKESRILMTYTDTFDSQSTLAHELGHAFHSHVLYDKPPLLQHYPMNIAEAASTMCEMIVADSALKNATSPKQKLLLLDDKITSYLAFNMNIHSRFLFETEFHEQRKKGFLTPDQISNLMVSAQKTAYGNGLESYLPHFWCYKMHFYFTDATFYNWPYTFGYLFSLGTYNILLNNDFENRYIALLRDSGSMNMEELALKHLGADLQKRDFWQGAINLLNNNIKEFISYI